MAEVTAFKTLAAFGGWLCLWDAVASGAGGQAAPPPGMAEQVGVWVLVHLRGSGCVLWTFLR